MSYSNSSNPPNSKKPKLDEQENAAQQDESPSSSSFFKPGRPTCQFGITCYRKNPHHFKEIHHPQLEELYTQIVYAHDDLDNYSKYEHAAAFANKEDLLQQLKILRGFGFGKNISINGRTKDSPNFSSGNSADYNKSSDKACSEKSLTTTAATGSQSKDMLTKWNSSAPYHFFLTKLSVEKENHFSICFRDLFDASLGQVKEVCHFNFMIEFEWLLEESLAAGLEGKPMCLIYGEPTPELSNASSAFPWITTQLIKSPFPYGHHHTKLSLIKYEDDSVRFIVSTANLIESDWDKRTQGVWIGPKCPAMSSGTTGGESPTNFRRDLVQYLTTYASKRVAPWITAIRNCDCSEIKVAFIGSAPVTTAMSTNGFEWGHKKVDRLLKECSNPKVGTDWPLILQCSSIGTLGPNDDWLRHEIGASFTSASPTSALSSSQTPMHVIFPSLQNVRNSFDGVNGGGCLPYSFETHSKQQWFIRYLHQWKSDLYGRTRAVPHIKSYCRISPDSTRLAWFLLTSANLSKAAWGRLNKGRNKLGVMSWEAGVLFIPKYFGCETFPVVTSAEPSSNSHGTTPPFRLPFDVPVTKYERGDRPWIIEDLQNALAQAQSQSQTSSSSSPD